MINVIKDSLKVLILSVVVSLSVYLVLAQGGWVEPTVASPGGNVAAPLNTGSTGQSKSGGLILNTGGAVNGLIISSGNVGIGTAGPSDKLAVVGNVSVAPGNGYFFSNTDHATGLGYDVDSSTLRIGSYSTNPITFGFTNALDVMGSNWNPVMTIKAGKVGIGTTAPGASLDVSGSGGLIIRGTGNPTGTGAGIEFNGGTSPYMQAYNRGTSAYLPLIFTGSQFDFSPGGTSKMAILNNGNVGIGTSVTETSVFNSVGGSVKLAVTGSSASTDVLGNTDAGIVIVNTDDTANNTAGLHFAWQDTDGTPNFAGASIVSILGTKVAGQYPAGQLAFLTSIATNNAPSEKMRITAAGNVGIGIVNPGQKLSVAGTIESTSGGFKFPDGTTQATAAAAASSPPFNNLQVFSSSGTFNVPSTVSKVWVQVWGGGGGGGGGGTNGSGGGVGGGGGGYAAGFVAVTSGSSIAVTVGAAGFSGAAGGPIGWVGGIGGTSSFGSFVIANGGVRGMGGNNNLNTTPAGGNGIAGTILSKGQSGMMNYYQIGGIGGNAAFGGGGGEGGNGQSNPGGVGGFPGGGGGGGGGLSGVGAAAGGAGATGGVFVYY